jgi:hypothetical protein
MKCYEKRKTAGRGRPNKRRKTAAGERYSRSD